MRSRPVRPILLTAACAALLLPALPAHAARTTMISVTPAGLNGNGGSGSASISADGRFVAFSSGASDLVAGDTNGASDVFVHDRVTGLLQRVSVDSQGRQTGGASGSAISADGRFVVFASTAADLVAGDTNGNSDVFVHDRFTGLTERVSVDSNGHEGINSGETLDFGSRLPSISADGRFVAFHSTAANLVPGDTNAQADIFVHDRHTRTTSRVSVTSSGQQAFERSATFNSTISADGRFVAFASLDPVFDAVPNGVVDVLVHDRLSGTTTAASVDSAGNAGNRNSSSPALSADGRFVAFRSEAFNLVADDTNGREDVFVHDRLSGRTQRVSLSSGGGQGSSDILQLVDIAFAISADGRFVAFHSLFADLVEGDANRAVDIFLHDRAQGLTTRVSVDSAGRQRSTGRGSYGPAISADGRSVAFGSEAHNLSPVPDTNLVSDVFVRDTLRVANKAADLKLALAGGPGAVVPGEVAEFVFVVTQHGPDAVGADAQLVHVAGQGTVLAMTPSHGGCTVAAVSVCRFGKLAAGDSVTLSVQLRADGSGALAQQLGVGAPPTDPQPQDNHLRVETPLAP